MKALLFAALCAILLAAPATTAADTDAQACLTDGDDPDIDLVCTGPSEVCVAAGDDWDRLTREGTGCFAT